MKILVTFLLLYCYSLEASNKFGIWENLEVNHHVLYVLEKYESENMTQHKFLSWHGGVIYPSYPPAFFVFSWASWRIFGRPEKYIFLKCLSFYLLLISSLFLYKIFRYFKIEPITAFLSCLVYIFMPTNLHFGISCYWAHHLWMPLFLASILSYFQGKKGLFLFLSFLQCYIIWEGYVVSYVFSLIFFLKRDYKNSLSIIFLAGLAFLINALHFSLEISMDSYFMTLVARQAYRSGSESGWLDCLRKIILLENSIFLVVSLFCLIFVFKIIDYKKFLNCLLLFIPCFASFVIAQHDFTYGFGRMKFLPGLILIFAFIIEQIPIKARIPIILSLVVLNYFIYLELYDR